MSGLQARLSQALDRDARRVLVLDDDPTGTQSVADVNYVLDLSESALRQALNDSAGALYVLTNTRAHPRREATAIVRRVVDVVAERCREQGRGLAVVLRGDSTLRGHVFAEIDALSSHDAVSLFVPAFPEAGRLTIGGVHYLTLGGRLVPVASSEYARDPDFGYTESDVACWAAKAPGARSATKVRLSAVRKLGPSAVTEALVHAEPGSVVIPDVETDNDMRAAVLGLLDAERHGRRVVARGSPAFAAQRAGLTTAALAPSQPDNDNTTRLVVCGSFTDGATAQLRALESVAHPAVYLQVDSLRPDAAAIDEAEAALRLQFAERRLGILATSRTKPKTSDDPALRDRIMGALVEVVRRLGPSCDLVVAKGGITSARLARDGLGARIARVEGQLEPGVTRWRIPHPRPGFAFVVVPGNVGGEWTLANAVGIIRHPSVA